MRNQVSPLNSNHPRVMIQPSNTSYFRRKYTSFIGTSKLILSYTEGEIKRNPRPFKIGVCSIFLVVAFLSLMQSVIQLTPVIFIRIAENQAGDSDIIMSPIPAENDTRRSNSSGLSVSSLPFLNATEIERVCDSLPAVYGCAPRWLIVGNATRNNTSIKVKSYVLVGDTQKEKSVGIGRRLQLEALSEDEAYITRSTTASLGIIEGSHTPIVLQMDIMAAIVSQDLLAISDTTLDNEIRIDGRDPTNMDKETKLKTYFRIIIRQNLIEQLGNANISDNQTFNTNDIRDFGNAVNNSLNTGIFSNDVIFNATINSLASTFGLPSNLAGNDGGVISRGNVNNFVTISNGLPPNTSFTGKQLLDTMVDVILNSTNLRMDLKVKAEVRSAQGKWAEALGNVVFMDSKWVTSTLAKGFSNAINETYKQRNQTDFLGVFVLRLLVESNVSSVWNQYVRDVNISNYAILENAVLNNRINLYQDETTFIPYFAKLTDDIKKSFNGTQPFTSTTSLALAMTSFLILKTFLDNVIMTVVFILVLLSILLIYSLMIFDVEDKTYEYGMTRALGFGKSSLVALLLVQGMTYAVCGLTLALLFTYIAHTMVASMIYDSALEASTFELPWTALLLAFSIGILMPLISNTIPIYKALGKTLRESLNLYMRTVNEFSVKVQKLEKMGLSPGSMVNSLMLIIIGLLTYYLAPLAFITQNIRLFLTILNIILMIMIMGMSILAHQAEGMVTTSLLWISMNVFKRDKRLKHIVSKNMEAHSSKNKKTSLIFSITIAFLIFSATSFNLQEFFIVNLLKMTFGSDLVVWAPQSYNKGLDEYQIKGFLNTYMDNNPGVIKGFTFVSNELTSIDGIDELKFMPISNFPKQKCKVYGIEKGYMNAVYQDLFFPSTYDSTISFPTLSSGKRDPVAGLYTNEGIPLVRDVIDPYLIQSNSIDEPSNSTIEVIKTIIPEGLRIAMSLDPSTAALFEKDGLLYYSRIRGMAAKVPGFLFSSYQQAIFFMQLLVSMEDFQNIANINGNPPNTTTTTAFANISLNIPKSRLLIKFDKQLSFDESAILQNGIRNFFTSDLTVMIDMVKTEKDISESFQLLQLFFIAVTIISLTISFFLILVSFISNIRNNSWEFGVLRAIGMNRGEITRVYLYEAGILMLGSSILGTIVGITVAITVTMQMLLFLEMQLIFTFPFAVFFLVFGMGMTTSILGSYYAVRSIRDKPISDVIKGLI